MTRAKLPSEGNFALLLAAGGGQRFGGSKLTANWRGEPLVRAAARNALAGPFEEVVVVTGHDDEAVAAALAGLYPDRLSFVHNARWRDGIAHSLGCGLSALPRHAARVAIFLGDMPRVDPALAAILLWRLGSAPAILAHAGDQPLHPVVVARAAFPLLLKLRGDRGARGTLAALAGTVQVEHDVPASALDIDRPADLDQ